MIAFQNITVRYEDTGELVYEDFSETIPTGSFTLLTGESGSGKSTLLNLILKEIEPAAGEIVVNGKTLSKIPHDNIPRYRQGIGVVFQDFRLLPEFSAYENVELACLIKGMSRRRAAERVGRIMGLLGISHLYRRRPAQLSGGEQAKVGLARAIVNQPRILLCDEPTGNLDPESSAEVRRLLTLIHRQGVTVVVATHDTEFTCGYEGCRIHLTRQKTRGKKDNFSLYR